MQWQIRPRSTWTDPVTKDRRNAGAFRVKWDQVLAQLGDEIALISDEDNPVVVIELDVTEGDLRRDGMLRANARVGQPGVVVSFRSRFGPLRLATDAYEQWYSGTGLKGWQANVRAVGLTLRALRDLDRWGVSKRGEQYTGWKAIESGNGRAAGQHFTDATAAADWMRKYARVQLQIFSDASAMDRSDWAKLYRAMARKMHPDTGWPRADWDRLAEARDLLDRAGWL